MDCNLCNGMESSQAFSSCGFWNKHKNYNIYLINSVNMIGNIPGFVWYFGGYFTLFWIAYLAKRSMYLGYGWTNTILVIRLRSENWKFQPTWKFSCYLITSIIKITFRSFEMAGAESILNRGGLYLDELTRKIRLLHPDYHQLTQEITGDLEDYFQGKKTTSYAIIYHTTTANYIPPLPYWTVSKETESAAVKLNDALKAVVEQVNGSCHHYIGIIIIMIKVVLIN